MNSDQLLTEVSQQVARRFERVTSTSMLATEEAASVAGRDLALWLHRTVSRLGGEALLEVARHIPTPPWQPVNSESRGGAAEALTHAALVMSWSAVVATPVLARRVLLEDIRHALDLTSGVRQSSEARSVLEQNQQRLEGRSLPRAGIDPGQDMPASLQALAVRSAYLQNELSRESFERSVRHFASLDGYGVAFETAEATLRGAIEHALMDPEPPAAGRGADLSDHQDTLVKIAELLRMSVVDRKGNKANPSGAFAKATFRAFGGKVREARRLRPSGVQI